MFKKSLITIEIFSYELKYENVPYKKFSKK